MRHTLYAVLMGLSLMLLAACSSTQSGAIIKSISTTPDLNIQKYKHDKFALGPHFGLLGERQFYFSCSSAILPTRYLPAVRAQSQYLVSHPNAIVELQGFTRAAGSREYNISVGQRRADAIANQLKLNHAKPDQVTTVSFGGELFDAALKQNNCRVDLIYTRV
jgi:peptidoglycan-associated lipoprotein